MLTIALPKGRIAEQTLEKFEKAFGEKFVFEDRKTYFKKSRFHILECKKPGCTHICNVRGGRPWRRRA